DAASRQSARRQRASSGRNAVQGVRPRAQDGRRARSSRHRRSVDEGYALTDIAVVDYGMGNLKSVAKALRHVAPERTIVVSSDPSTIRNATRVVLPGQSAMPDCMRCLHESGLADVVLDTSVDRPFLGICLGLQMLFDASEEGPTPGLGVLAGQVVRFRDAA